MKPMMDGRRLGLGAVGSQQATIDDCWKMGIGCQVLVCGWHEMDDDKQWLLGAQLWWQMTDGKCQVATANGGWWSLGNNGRYRMMGSDGSGKQQLPSGGRQSFSNCWQSLGSGR